MNGAPHQNAAGGMKNALLQITIHEGNVNRDYFKNFIKIILILSIIIFILNVGLMNARAEKPWELKKNHIGIVIVPGHGIMDWRTPPVFERPVMNSITGREYRGNNPRIDNNEDIWFINESFDRETEYREDVENVETAIFLKDFFIDQNIYVDSTREIFDQDNLWSDDITLGGHTLRPRAWFMWRRTKTIFGGYNKDKAIWINGLQNNDPTKDYVSINIHTDAGMEGVNMSKSTVWLNYSNSNPSELQNSNKWLGQFILINTIESIREQNFKTDSGGNWKYNNNQIDNPRIKVQNNQRIFMNSDPNHTEVNYLKVPGVIIEYAFHTSPHDLLYLTGPRNKTFKKAVAGGLYNGTLEYFNSSVISTNSTGDETDFFSIGETVYVKGDGYPPSMNVVIHVTRHRDYKLNNPDLEDWNRDVKFKDIELKRVNARVNEHGHLSAYQKENGDWINNENIEVWKTTGQGKYDIVVSIFNHTNFQYVDAVDNMTEVPGFIVDNIGFESIEGKGVWIYNSTNFMLNSVMNIEKVKEINASHIVFPLNTRDRDFIDYSRDYLLELIPIAHQNGIKVLGWIQPDIDDIPNRYRNIRETVEAAKTSSYNCPNTENCFDKLDGIIVNITYQTISENIHRPNINDITTYADEVYNNENFPDDLLFIVAPDFKLDSIVQGHPDENVKGIYPAFGNKFNIIIPQVYWVMWSEVDNENLDNFVGAVDGQVHLASKNPNVSVGIITATKNGASNLDSNEIATGLQAARDSDLINIDFWKYEDISPLQSNIIKEFNWPTSISIYNYESDKPPSSNNLHRNSVFKEGGYRFMTNTEKKREKYVDGQYHINGIPIKSFVNDYIRLENDQYVEYSFRDNNNGNGYSGEYVYLLLNAVNGLRAIKGPIGEITISYIDSQESVDLELGKNIRNNYDGNLVWNYFGYDPMFVTELKDPNAGIAWVNKKYDGDWWVGMLRIKVNPDKLIDRIKIASVDRNIPGYDVKPGIQLMGISVIRGDYPVQVLPISVKKKSSSTVEPNIFGALYYMTVGRIIQTVSPLTAFDYSPFQSVLALELAKVFSKLSIDPLDANYTEMVQPSHFEVPQLNYSDDLPHNLTDQLNSELMTEVETYAYLEALYTSINRYSTAMEVKDYNSAEMQLAAIKQFSESAYFSMDKSGKKLQAINQEWQELNLTNPALNLTDIINMQNNISESGFPPEVMEAFAVFNATPEEIQQMRNQISDMNTEGATLDFISLISQKETNYLDMGRELIGFSNNITIHPYITNEFPQNLESNVSVETNITAIFSERINPNTINGFTFILMDSDGIPVNGTVTLYSSGDEKVIFEPELDIEYDTYYKATLTTGIESLSGTNMQSNYTWRFTTKVEPDITPPITNILPNPPIPNGKNYWYISNTQVNITAIDIQSGVNRTEYSFDNTTWINYSSAFIVDTEGNTTIYARSYDNVNNVESPVKIEFKLDRTNPVTTAVLNGSLLNGTFTKNATLTLTATDNLSGIASINYSIDGIIWNNYLEPVTITKMGLSRIFYRSEDNASNIEEAKSIDVVISNPPPILNIIPDITVNETELVRITPTASDPESDPLTFTFSPPLNSSGMWQTTYEDAGEYTTRVTVSDGFSNVSQDVKITVLNVNRPPILVPIGALSAIEGSYFSYSVSASDPDNDQLTYSDDSPMFEINPFTGEIGFVPQDAGNYSFNITVSDGAVSISQEVILEVRNTNNAPEIEFIFPKIALVGGNFTLQVNASDEDGDDLTYGDDTGLFDINATTGRIEFTPGSEQIGTYFINITVTDGIENDHTMLNLVVRPDKPLKLEPIQGIVAYVGDLVKLIANATYAK